MIVSMIPDGKSHPSLRVSLVYWSGITLLIIGGCMAFVAMNTYQCACPVIITPAERYQLSFYQNSVEIEIGVIIATLGIALIIATGQGLRDRTTLLGFASLLIIAELLTIGDIPTIGNIPPFLGPTFAGMIVLIVAFVIRGLTRKRSS